ncbi:MAG: hypothetical protein K1X75_14565 [Leptospirales bacterium]|nr:hypothetical protein [Leptospirales bacterium]
MRRLLSVLLLGLTPISLVALPPMMPLAERFQNADVVVLARLAGGETRPFSEVSQHASVSLQIEERLKGDVANQVWLYFMVFPYSYERHLRQVPPDGRYFVFLRRSADGALLPIDPRPFAFAQFSDDTLAQLRSLAGR